MFDWYLSSSLSMKTEQALINISNHAYTLHMSAIPSLPLYLRVCGLSPPYFHSTVASSSQHTLLTRCLHTMGLLGHLLIIFVCLSSAFTTNIRNQGLYHFAHCLQVLRKLFVQNWEKSFGEIWFSTAMYRLILLFLLKEIVRSPL